MPQVSAYDSTHSDASIPGNEANAYFTHLNPLWDRIDKVLHRVKVGRPMLCLRPTVWALLPAHSVYRRQI